MYYCVTNNLVPLMEKPTIVNGVYLPIVNEPLRLNSKFGFDYKFEQFQWSVYSNVTASIGGGSGYKPTLVRRQDTESRPPSVASKDTCVGVPLT